MNDQTTTNQPSQPEKPENVFVSLLFNIALPSIILSKLSDLDRLGPMWALLVAISFPLGYFVWDYVKRGKPNFIAILGFVSVLLSGGFGLFKLEGFWFAVKEAAIPLLIGAAVLGSAWTKKPLIRMLLYNEKIIDVDLVKQELESRGHVAAFEKLLKKATWLLAASFLLSGILNYGLAIYLLKSPAGTPEFMQELGKMTAMSYPVIVLPCMVVMGLALWVLIKGIKDLTGLDMESVFKTPPPKPKKA